MEETTLGRYLRESRRLQEKTLDEVAQLINVSKMYLSQIETDKKIPSDEVIRNLATSYKVDEDCLFKLSGKLSLAAREELHENENIQNLFSRVKKGNLDNNLKREMYKEIESIFRKYLEEN